MTDSETYRLQAKLHREAAIGYRRAGIELDLLALELDRLADALDAGTGGEGQDSIPDAAPDADQSPEKEQNDRIP